MEKTCRYGHECDSDCQNTKDCPCLNDHCCAFSENVCDGSCDDCFFKEVVEDIKEVASNEPLPDNVISAEEEKTNRHNHDE